MGAARGYKRESKENQKAKGKWQKSKVLRALAGLKLILWEGQARSIFDFCHLPFAF